MLIVLTSLAVTSYSLQLHDIECVKLCRHDCSRYFCQPPLVFSDIISKLKHIHIVDKLFPKVFLRTLDVILSHGFRLQDYFPQPVSLRVPFPSLRKIRQKERIIYLVGEGFWNRMPIIPNQSVTSLSVFPNTLKPRNNLVPFGKPVEE